MVTPLSPLCTGVSHMNSTIAQTLSQNQTLAITLKLWPFLWLFWSILAKIWLLWQRPLDPCNQKCLLQIGRPRKPPVISNHILVISHRNAFTCIHSNFSPKIGCRGNAPLSLVYGSVTDEFPDGTNPISKPNAAWICRLQLKLWPFFVIFWPILAKIWLPWQRPLDRCNQKCLIWIDRPQKPYPTTKLIRRFATSLALRE